MSRGAELARHSMVAIWNRAFAFEPMDEAAVNACVDWLMEEEATLEDVCELFACVPDPQQGWQWVLARFDRLTNGEEKRTPRGERRCNAARLACVDDAGYWPSDWGVMPDWRIRFVRHVLEMFRPEIDPEKILQAVGWGPGPPDPQCGYRIPKHVRKSPAMMDIIRDIAD